MIYYYKTDDNDRIIALASEEFPQADWAKYDFPDSFNLSTITDYKITNVGELIYAPKSQEELAAEKKHLPLSESEVIAMLIAAQINTLSVDDATAVRMVAFYPEWASGIAYTVGYKVQYDSKLYRTIQAHTSQETWTPDVTPALYERIDEVHDGTKYDPIPYSGNMALENGKYYTQDSVTYKCTRDTGVAVYNTLADLVGIYVEME